MPSEEKVGIGGFIPITTWEEKLKESTRTLINSEWLNTHYQGAIDIFQSDVITKGGGGYGRLVLDLYFSILGKVPVVGEIASATYDIGKILYDIHTKADKKQIAWNDFVEQFVDNKIKLVDGETEENNVGEKVGGLGDFASSKRLEIYKVIDEKKAEWIKLREDEIDKLHREQRKDPKLLKDLQLLGSELNKIQKKLKEIEDKAKDERDEGLKKLKNDASKDKILQAITLDWVHSAEDSSGDNDWGGTYSKYKQDDKTAGVIYFYWSYNLEEQKFSTPILTAKGAEKFKTGRFDRRGPFIDDIAENVFDATFELMKSAFGENTYLDEIEGIQFNVQITFYHVEENHHYEVGDYGRRIQEGWIRMIKPVGETDFTITIEPVGETNLVFPNPVMLYKNWTDRPKISDLVPD